jgi:hypothetical protein
MKIGLLGFVVPCVAVVSAIATSTLPAAADSTSSLVMNLSCDGSTSAEVWKNRKTGGLFFRGTSPTGKMTSYLGKTQKTEGVQVYKFQSGNMEYWVWDGNLDNPQAASLEIYNNSRLVKRHECKRV